MRKSFDRVESQFGGAAMQTNLTILTLPEYLLLFLIYVGLGILLMALLGGIAALVEMMIGRRERRWSFQQKKRG